MSRERTAPGLPEAPQTDEVGVAFGPDAHLGGLFDPPGESTQTGERTGHDPVGAAVGQRRTAVLAWIASPPDDLSPAPDRGPPCEAVKRAIADEPLDPLPPLDGVPWRTGTRPAASPPPVAISRRSEREDTATAVDFSRPSITTIERQVTPRWVWPLVAFAIAAVAWALFQAPA